MEPAVDLTLTAEQAQLREVVTALCEKHSAPEHVRAAEPLGFDRELHRRLLDVGVPGVGVSEEAGGVGGGLVEAGIIAEVAGRWLAPAPVVESSVAARAVAAATGSASDVLAGTVLTFCPRPAHAGVAPLVPYGAVAEAVVAMDADGILLVRQDPPGDGPPNLGCTALADVALAGEVLELDAGGGSGRFERARDEWFALSAAALTGLAARALEIGVDYVKQRHQFGVPIGSFQAVAHRLADVATEVDGATLLWQNAVWALDEQLDTAPAAARMAFVFAAEVAERAALTSLHFHGGYGFMLEYDIQLYARRAKAWALAGGSRSSVVDHLADALYGQVR